MPLVMAVLHEPTDTYLVMGTPGLSRSGNLVRNRFGLAFQAAAAASKARVRHESFETNVAEVEGEDITAFLDGLQLELSGGRDGGG